jgi:uncharacterized protein
VNFEVPGSDGRVVRCVAHGDDEAPAVLVCHGFKGFKDWGLFPWLAERIAKAGFRALRLDFSHNGVAERDFDRLDLFLLDTYGRHLEDLAAVAAGLPGPLGVVGHSRGGADALLFAAAEPRVSCVATLAGVAHAGRLPADLDTILAAKGFYPFPNARTGQVMPVALPFFEDARTRSVEQAARAFGGALLVLHGTADASVPPSDADDLARWHGRAERVLLKGAGHTFGAVHPFEGPTAPLEEAAGRIVAFLRAHLA